MGNKNTHFYHDEIYLDPHTHRPEKLVQHKYEACLYESKMTKDNYENEYLIESNESGMKPDEWQEELKKIKEPGRKEKCKRMKDAKLSQITSMHKKILEDNLVFNCIDNKVEDEVEREPLKITNTKNTENIKDYNDCKKDTNLPKLISDYNNNIIKKYAMNSNYSKYTKSLENLTNKIKNIEKSARSKKQNIKDYVENNMKPNNKTIYIGDTELENNDLNILENICKIDKNDDRLEELRKCNNSKRESNCIKDFNNYKEYKKDCEKCKDGDRTGDCKDKRDSKQGGNFTRIFKNGLGKGFFPLIYWLFVVFTILLFGLIFSYIFYFIRLIFVHLIYDRITYIMIGVTQPDDNKDSYDKTDGREFKSYSDNAPLGAIVKNICKLFAIMIRKSHWWIIPIWLVLFVSVYVFWIIKKTLGWWPASMVWDSIGIFKGSKTAFRWLDAVEGCNKKSNRPIICNSQATWNLLEDWNYENIKFMDPDLDEDEFRQRFNFIKTFNPEYNWSGTKDKSIQEIMKQEFDNRISNKNENENENFTDYNKYKNNNNLIENFFIMDKLMPVKQKLNDIIKKNNDELRLNNENNKNKGEKNKKNFEDYLDSQDNSE
tara:strand:+ start:20023 stop:21828 length:1806 start_codon:yes stop_codon:yes gene_type:complete